MPNRPSTQDQGNKPIAKKVKYELWDDGESGYPFFPEDNDSARKLLRVEAKLIWTIEAETWNDAMRAFHDHMGWEPYKPMSDQSQDSRTP